MSLHWQFSESLQAISRQLNNMFSFIKTPRLIIDRERLRLHTNRHKGKHIRVHRMKHTMSILQEKKMGHTHIFMSRDFIPLTAWLFCWRCATTIFVCVCSVVYVCICAFDWFCDCSCWCLGPTIRFKNSSNLSWRSRRMECRKSHMTRSRLIYLPFLCILLDWNGFVCWALCWIQTGIPGRKVT